MRCSVKSVGMDPRDKPEDDGQGIATVNAR
jgi:hypothetical protein